MGGKITEKYPYPCERCNGTKFHICRDGDDWVAFCDNDKCLKEDSDASNEIARAEYVKRKERNSYGQIMTGAEKFRMGSSYKNACLASWMAPIDSQRVVSNWVKDQRPFLVVLGNPGTGKTYLSASILNLLFDNKEEVFYTTHRRYIEDLHRAIEDNKTQHSVIERYAHKKYLILDDLAAATCTEWQKEMILELIDRRYSNESKTLITSNLDIDGLSEELGHRIASRIFDKKNSLIQFWTEDNRRN